MRKGKIGKDAWNDDTDRGAEVTRWSPGMITLWGRVIFQAIKDVSNPVPAERTPIKYFYPKGDMDQLLAIHGLSIGASAREEILSIARNRLLRLPINIARHKANIENGARRRLEELRRQQDEDSRKIN